MPQLVGLLVLGVGIYAAFKGFERIAQRVAVDMTHVEEERRRAAAVDATEKDLGALEWDEVHKVYRPKRIG